MSMVIDAKPTKLYEKPASGSYHGVLADVIDLGMVTSTYKGETKTLPMVRFIWILNANGTDGKPLSVQQKFNASLHEKANLYKALKQILNTPPPIPFDLELLIGQTRQLFIVREEGPPQRPGEPNRIYANVQGILPAQQGAVVQIPADFIRAKFRPKTQAGPQGQPVQTYAQPPQQPQWNPQPAQPPAAGGFYQPPIQPSPQQQAPPPVMQQGADVKF
jgi:hypothetical protein